MKMTPLSAAGFAFTTLFPIIGRAAECHKGGDMVTVAGIIHTRCQLFIARQTDDKCSEISC